jgi:hypothetical protein
MFWPTVTPTIGTNSSSVSDFGVCGRRRLFSETMVGHYLHDDF